jgi:very-short-patch-repair endonuclease
MQPTDRARELRLNLTDAERHLWRYLRRHTFGASFRKQVPIGSFVVDFACLSRRLVIEIDGGQNLENAEDLRRDRWLRDQGYRVLRFWNHEVLTNVEGVLQVIASKVGGSDSRKERQEVGDGRDPG